MVDFILIPGAFHGAWCFDRLVPLLCDAGHRAVAVELSGTGEPASRQLSATRTSWIEQVVAHLERANGPSVLVGHSRGGVVASLVAEQAPELVSLSIYVAGALLPSGASPIRGMLDAQGVGHAAVPEHLPIPPFEIVQGVLYHQACDEDARLAYAKLCPEPTAPLIDNMVLSERFDRVPRAYVECLQDRAINIELQRSMQEHVPCRIVRSMLSDHSPFLSHQQALAEVLVEIVHAVGLK